MGRVEVSPEKTRVGRKEQGPDRTERRWGLTEGGSEQSENPRQPRTRRNWLGAGKQLKKERKPRWCPSGGVRGSEGADSTRGSETRGMRRRQGPYPQPAVSQALHRRPPRFPSIHVARYVLSALLRRRQLRPREVQRMVPPKVKRQVQN